MKEKKGDMTIGTLIAIILGLVVLVLLIVGFIGGWDTFLDRINIFSGGENNIAEYETSCQQACLLGSHYDFCEKKLPLYYEKGYTLNGDYTCNSISENDQIMFTPRDGEDIPVTMTVASCPEITC